MFISSDKSKGKLLPSWVLKAVLPVAITVVIGISSWFGLTYAFNTPHPLMVVEGTSMLPNLTDGDLVIVRGVTPEEVEVGDVIVFNLNTPSIKGLVVHRVIEITSNGEGSLVFKTKGDHNPPTQIERVPEENLVGKVIYTIPSLGSFIRLIRAPPVLFAIGIVIVLLFAWSVWDEAERKVRGGGEAKGGKETSPLAIFNRALFI